MENTNLFIAWIIPLLVNLGLITFLVTREKSPLLIWDSEANTWGERRKIRMMLSLVLIPFVNIIFCWILAQYTYHYLKGKE